MSVTVLPNALMASINSRTHTHAHTHKENKTNTKNNNSNKKKNKKKKKKKIKQQTTNNNKKQTNKTHTNSACSDQTTQIHTLVWSTFFLVTSCINSLLNTILTINVRTPSLLTPLYKSILLPDFASKTW